MAESLSAYSSSGWKEVLDVAVHHDGEWTDAKTLHSYKSGAWVKLFPLSSGDLPIGTIGYYPSNSLPDGWLIADGRILNIVDYPDLAAALGTRFGGNESTFTLPDYTGQAYFLGSSNTQDDSIVAAYIDTRTVTATTSNEQASSSNNTASAGERVYTGNGGDHGHSMINGYGSSWDSGDSSDALDSGHKDDYMWHYNDGQPKHKPDGDFSHRRFDRTTNNRHKHNTRGANSDNNNHAHGYDGGIDWRHNHGSFSFSASTGSGSNVTMKHAALVIVPVVRAL